MTFEHLATMLRKFAQRSVCAILCFVATSFSTLRQGSVKELRWNVGDTIRKALVYIPSDAKVKKSPIIFAFHGHGGTMENSYKSRAFDKLWPEAIFVCPQGLKTPGKLTDPEGKRNGWSLDKGTNNRDLAFFDTMLAAFKKDYKIDTRRIYITGHSNGGAFTYLLWAERGDQLAAIAPTAASGGKFMRGVKPRPFFLAMGKKDPLVKPEMQKLTFEVIKKLNKCLDKPADVSENVVVFNSPTGNDTYLFTHEGGHEYLSEMNTPIINFFKKIFTTLIIDRIFRAILTALQNL